MEDLAWRVLIDSDVKKSEMGTLKILYSNIDSKMAVSVQFVFLVKMPECSSRG